MENNDIIKIAKAKAEKWLDKAYDEKTREEVKRMLENTDTTELIESFYNDLEFGTGGLRGIMGVGTNRMNIYTCLLYTSHPTGGHGNRYRKCRIYIPYRFG